MPRPVHFEIHASDPAASKAFYEQLFGWHFHRWDGAPYWLVSTGDGNPMTGELSSEPGIDGGLLERMGISASRGPLATESPSLIILNPSGLLKEVPVLLPNRCHHAISVHIDCLRLRDCRF